ncbi:hypothetical protein BDZ91DRAFT_803346 [Kalaharituber pfeilii]|nr:hypothetical protein BDZ91DRAFT_803346 [Kalaharituber pfeilii]
MEEIGTTDMITGDCNCHHREWSDKEDTRGTLLKNLTQANGLTQQIDKGTITWTRRVGRETRTALLDLVFARNGEWKTNGISWIAGADHAMLIGRLESERTPNKTIRVTDWEKWDDFIEEWENCPLKDGTNAYELLCRLGQVFTKEAKITDQCNFVTTPTTASTPQAPRRPTGLLIDREEARKAIDQALLWTKPRSAPGPDRIQYGLLKLIKGITLWAAVREEIVDYINRNYQFACGLDVVMILKKERPRNEPGSWRLITLLNTVAKLGQKVVATRIQKQDSLFRDT